jgi:hypothetical protein
MAEEYTFVTRPVIVRGDRCIEPCRGILASPK